MSENRETRRNKDIDLLKIQILADYYQASFNFFSSIVTGSFIGVFVIFVTFRLQNSIDQLTYLVVLGVISVVFGFYWIRTIRIYHSDLEKIDTLFTRVQNGEALPSITELRKMKKLEAVEPQAERQKS